MEAAADRDNEYRAHQYAAECEDRRQHPEKYVVHEQEFDDYEEECFWDHLIYRMADKDLVAKLGDKAEKLTNEERIDMIDPISEKYVKEFEENGIDNLVIK